MRNFIYGAVAAILLILGAYYLQKLNSEEDRLEPASAFIQEQLKQVGKLVVTEGTFSQVYTYKNSKKFYFDVFSAQKKALIVVNARAIVSYDLSKLELVIDEPNKTIRITHIPKEEIAIYPEIQYYDVTQDYLNQFEAADHNKIRDRIRSSIREKVENSALKANAEDRLISELQKIYILTSSLGWTLEYKGTALEGERLQEIDL